MTLYLAAFLISYLLGSIPFGLLLTRAAGLGDIRNIGSGNIGATNVLRTGNKKLAAATLLLDGLKGAAAVLLVEHFSANLGWVAALGALLGHLFPLWLKFKGGKGVATGIGVMTALAWPVGLTIMIVWVLMAKRFKISSLAALTAFGLAPLDVIIFGHTNLVPLSFIVVGLIFFQHRANIHRLFLHTEPKIGQKHPPATPIDNRFVISRVFDASLEQLWKAWTERNSIGAWLGPKDTQVQVLQHDFRVGGVLHSGFTPATGPTMWGKFLYREITPQSRLMWEHSFADEHGQIVRHPFSPTWPLKMLTTVTFEKISAHQTRVTLTWTPLDAKIEEEKTFADGMESMSAGWNGSFDRLTDLLEKQK